MMDKARRHSSASSYGVGPEPADSIIMSILLEHEKDIERLKRGGSEGR